MPLSTRAWLRAAGLAAAVLAVYGAGVVTGAVAAGGGAPGAAAAAPSPAQTASVLDEAAARIQAEAARPVDAGVLQRAAVEGMLRALGDRWSRYLGPTEYTSFSDSLEGRYTGVGLWLALDHGGTVVSGVQAGSPAARAGLRTGDRLVAVDGADVRAEALAEVARRLRGDAGTRVVLGVRRGAAALEVPVRRAALEPADVTVERLTGGVRTVRVAAFTRGVGRQLRQALAGDTRSAGVVLDLRGNPGGLLTEAVDVAGAFLDGGPVVSYETRGSGTRTLDAMGSGDTVTPLVVLVDGATASAAEIVAAALQDRHRAIVVGARTYGKGSVQESSPLGDGSALELTVGRYRTPSGELIDGVGVEPDVVAEGSRTAAEARALEVLRGLVAATGGRG